MNKKKLSRWIIIIVMILVVSTDVLIKLKQTRDYYMGKIIEKQYLKETVIPVERTEIVDGKPVKLKIFERFEEEYNLLLIDSRGNKIRYSVGKELYNQVKIGDKIRK